MPFPGNARSCLVAEIFVRYRRKIYFPCRAFHSEGTSAEDATQETFLRAYEKIGEFSTGDFGDGG